MNGYFLGEYVRPEFIQNIYKQSRFVNNIFVYGDSFQRYLVAIIVPDFEALTQFIENNKDFSDLKGKSNDDIIKDERVYLLIKNDMAMLDNKTKLNGFERVKKFKLISEEFTSDNGLLTISMKLKRNEAKLRFKPMIDEMYKLKAKL